MTIQSTALAASRFSRAYKDAERYSMAKASLKSLARACGLSDKVVMGEVKLRVKRATGGPAMVFASSVMEELHSEIRLCRWPVGE